MPRHREFDEEQVLSALRDVFWEHGFDGVSYAQIMERTGLQKGSLYAAFGDKRALYHKAITQYDMSVLSEGVTMLRDTRKSGKTRIATLFESLVKAAETPQGRWGCLLCNAAAEQAPFHADTENIVFKSMTRLRQAISAALLDTSSPDHIDMIWAGYFGGHTLVKAGASKTVLRRLKKQITAQL